MALTIVLLCSGNGSDSSHYRPSRDDARYRHRHDALVRCVASTLFGAAGSEVRTPCEVVFFYDGDFSCMHMRLARPSTSSLASAFPSSMSGRDPPLEKDIVAEWRRASKEAIRRREQHVDDLSNERGPASWMTPSASPSFSSGTMGKISSIGRVSERRNRRVPNRHGGKIFEEDLPRFETFCVLDSWKTVSSSLTTATISSNNDKNSLSSVSKHGGKPSINPTMFKQLPSHIPSSKRDILTTLQSTCPVDYLRTHHLNVPLDVALRKCNKNKLIAAWEDYRGYCSEKSSATKEEGNTKITDARKSNNVHNNTANGNCRRDNRWDEIERTFRSLMKKAKSTASWEVNDDDEVEQTSHSEYSTDVMAAYLHESCDAELPCWGWDLSTAIVKVGDNEESNVKHIFLFLGAVRDMTATENDALSHACNRLRIPLVPCRLGPVPEFTSKIISVAGYHYHRGVLGGGLVGLWKRQRSQESQSKPKQSPNQNVVIQALSHKRTLHVIAILPIDSRSLTSDPSYRTRAHWCMVRLCVCSLWRSKLASTSEDDSSHTTLNNVLTFVFNDGKKMTLEQMEFISTMAENHQAAPSERQILEELCRRRDNIGPASNGDISFLSNGEESSRRKAFALDFTDFSTRQRGDASSTQSFRQIFDLAYSKDVFENQSLYSNTDTGKSAILFAIIQVQSIGRRSDDEIAKEVDIHNDIISSLSLANIQIQGQNTIIKAQDGEACTVMMLQHLDYQGFLFPLLDLLGYEHGKSLSRRDVDLTDNHQELKKRKKKREKDDSGKKEKKHKSSHKNSRS
ncbi:hypothetical protein ACHAXS_006349 [Conticribra weissflogii]